MSPSIAQTTARIESMVVKAIADAPDPQTALAEIMDIVADERRGAALEASTCLTDCTDTDPQHQTCNVSRTDLPVPFGLDVREGQLLAASLTRLRGREHPVDEVFIQSGGNGTGLTPEAADQLADQMVTFAAQVRRMARQIGNATEAAKAHA